MDLWQTLILQFLTTLLPCLITGIVTYLIAKKQGRVELTKIEKQVENNLLEYKSKEILEIKKKAIFNSLSLIDDYISWLTIGDGKNTPERRNITKLELTETGRQCYNELCLTCSNSEILNLFLDILFEKDNESNLLELYSKFRNAARKELNLDEINFDSDKIFISRLATKNMK